MINIEKCLKRLQYHWFLGLRGVSESSKPNVWARIELWKTQPSVVADIRKRQAKILQRFWLIRLVYWVFNVSHYAEHHYTLGAYDLVFTCSEEDKIKMFSNTGITEVPKNVVGLFKKTFSQVAGFIKNASPFGTSGEESHTESKQKPAGSTGVIQAELTKKETIVVEKSMIAALAILHLNYEIGQNLPFNVLKKAYFERAIATHPDKNLSPDAKEIFQSVLGAYEELNAVFEGKTVSVSKSYFDLWQELQEIEKQFENFSKGLAELQKKIEETTTIWHEVNSQYTHGIENLNAQQLEIQEHGHSIQEMTEELAKMTQEVADIAAQNSSQNSVPQSDEPVQHSLEATIEISTEETQASPLSQFGHFSHSAPPSRAPTPEADGPQPEAESQTI
jgi:archaellum component FlaC